MKMLIILILLTGCRADNFDPTTSVLKWIIKNEKK